MTQNEQHFGDQMSKEEENERKEEFNEMQAKQTEGLHADDDESNTKH